MGLISIPSQIDVSNKTHPQIIQRKSVGSIDVKKC